MVRPEALTHALYVLSAYEQGTLDFLVVPLDSPEVLADNLPVEVPSDALGAYEGEDMCVVMVAQGQEPGHQGHQALQLFFRVLLRKLQCIGLLEDYHSKQWLIGNKLDYSI